MHFVKSTLIVAALAISSTAALAADDNVTSCLSAAKQVSTALESSTSQNADAAKQEKKMGMEFCNVGRYHEGMQHYSKALQLLGASN